MKKKTSSIIFCPSHAPNAIERTRWSLWRDYDCVLWSNIALGLVNFSVSFYGVQIPQQSFSIEISNLWYMGVRSVDQNMVACMLSYIQVQNYSFRKIIYALHLLH